MPMKKRMAYRPPADWMSGARPTGMAPTRRVPAKTLRGPKRSHRGPATKRTRRLCRGVEVST